MHFAKIATFVTALLLGTSVAAEAGTITWNFENVNLSDGNPADNASLIGSFTTDATTLNITAYDINVVGGPYGTGTGYHFSNLIANFVLADGPTDYGVSNFGNGFVVWDLASPLSAGDTSANISFAEFFCAACNDYNITTTSGEIAQAPEPITLTLFGAGLVGTFAMRRRKKKLA